MDWLEPILEARRTEAGDISRDEALIVNHVKETAEYLRIPIPTV